MLLKWKILSQNVTNVTEEIVILFKRGIKAVAGKNRPCSFSSSFLVTRHFSKCLVKFVRNGFELLLFIDQLVFKSVHLLLQFLH